MAQPPKVCDAGSVTSEAQSPISFCVGTGTWPYTYAACDVGTVPNQTLNGSPSGIGGLSYLPGQRLSACSCPGSDHPGPSVNVGRNVPEIDILEAQIDVSRFVGEASQSLQVAPFNANYQFNDAQSASPIQSSTTKFNSYTGGPYQQAISGLTDINSTNYNGSGYSTYAYEWWSDPNDRSGGYIQWYTGGQKTWKATYETLAGDTTTGISNRIIPEEPMVRLLAYFRAV
jgi:beta-glucan synthesis-associated protein KRE6